MELRHLVTIALGLLSLPIVAASQNAFGTLSFSPVHPTTNDTITVVFTPADGQPNWCSFFSSVSGSHVYVLAFPFDCPPENGTQNAAVIGKLAAGSYDVLWTFTDNFDNVPVPTGMFTVVHAPAQIPVLSALGLFAVAFSVAFLGLQRIRPGASAR